METTKHFCSTCHTEHGEHCADTTILKVYTISGHDRIKHRRSVTDHHGEEFVFLQLAPTTDPALHVMDQHGRTRVIPAHRFPIIITVERLR